MPIFYQLVDIVFRCFEPSQPLGVTSGLIDSLKQGTMIEKEYSTIMSDHKERQDAEWPAYTPTFSLSRRPTLSSPKQFKVLFCSV